MTMRSAGFAMALALLLPARPGPAAGQDTPVGAWLTQGSDAVIAIAPCDGAPQGALCGRIVGVTLDHPDDPVPTAQDGRSQCGLTIIRDAVPDGDAGWSARIIDPRDGSAYRARLQLDERRNLRVRGYVGISLFGRTQVWTPFTGVVPADCRMVVVR